MLPEYWFSVEKFPFSGNTETENARASSKLLFICRAVAF